MQERKKSFSEKLGSGIDQAISVVAPRIALKRRAARQGMNYLSRAFKGADRGRLRGSWLPGGSSADQALLQDLPTLRERSRDLNRNDAYGSGITQTMQNNVIGTGIKPQARIAHKIVGLSEDQAQEFQQTAEREFNFWAMKADVGQRMTFYDIQDLVCRQIIESGETLILPLKKKRPGSDYSFCLQTIEADRLESPSKLNSDKRVRAGVRLGKHGEPVSYHIRKTHPGDYIYAKSERKYQEIKAFDSRGKKNIYHLYHVERPGQTRGIPFFAPVLNYFKDLGEYAEAELVAARISACFAMIIETENSPDEDPLGGSAPTLKNGQYLEGSMSPGMVRRIPPGEKFNSFNPSRPSSTFEPFVMWILRSISTSLGLPYELVAKDFSKTNYSSARAALLQAYKFFKKRQNWFANHLCQPVYEAVIEEAFLNGKFGDIPFYEFYRYFTQVTWMPAGWEWVDPLKEAKADEVALNNNTTTLAEVYAKKGTDWEEALEQIAKEKKKKEDLGISTEPVDSDISDFLIPKDKKKNKDGDDEE